MARITTALMKTLEKQVAKGEISYSRMVEILNDQHNVKDVNKCNKVEFYKIENYKTQFFKCVPNKTEVIKVCLGVDDLKKKQEKGIGIYQITSWTFYSNSPLHDHLIPCDEKEFNEAFEKAVSILKQ